MANYNDGKWHGWNGGECPVHPETVVEYAMRNGSDEAVARVLRWEKEKDDSNIIAFRVIKEHKEPREFWVHVASGYAHIMKPDGAEMGADYIHVREVLE